jgi:hypothetical protein
MAAAEEKLEALTEEAQQQHRQLEQQMAGGRLHVAVVVCYAVVWGFVELRQEQEHQQQLRSSLFDQCSTSVAAVMYPCLCYVT